MSLGLIPKVIPVKLFLDIVPSSFEVVTPAMRGLPKGFFRNYLREMAANLVKSRLYVLTFKRCFVPDFFAALSAVFLFGWAFVCFVLFGCSLFCRLFGFKEFKFWVQGWRSDESPRLPPMGPGFYSQSPFWTRSRLNIRFNFTFEIKAKRANLQGKQRKQKVYELFCF